MIFIPKFNNGNLDNLNLIAIIQSNNIHVGAVDEKKNRKFSIFLIIGFYCTNNWKEKIYIKRIDCKTLLFSTYDYYTLVTVTMVGNCN